MLAIANADHRSRITVGPAAVINPVHRELLQHEHVRLANIRDLQLHHQMGEVIELLDAVRGLTRRLFLWRTAQRIIAADRHAGKPQRFASTA